MKKIIVTLILCSLTIACFFIIHTVYQRLVDEELGKEKGKVAKDIDKIVDKEVSEEDVKEVDEGVSEVVGKELDRYKDIVVYSNGKNYSKSYGKHFSENSYYYGRKWQCVEYVKRFYYDALNHKMPELYGNATDFFDESVPQGGLNKQRDLLQYRNGGDVKPEQDDLLVFNDSKYGHVAIISKVEEDSIEVVQQNVRGKSREEFVLSNSNGTWTVGKKKKPAGWLRIKN